MVVFECGGESGGIEGVAMMPLGLDIILPSRYQSQLKFHL